MCRHQWLRPPVRRHVDCFVGAVMDGTIDYWHFEVIVPTTCCKHGQDECERCGTTNRRDAKHRTIGGRGLVARIK